MSRRDSQLRTRSVLKGIGLALGVGLALAWVAALLIPGAISIGLSQTRAHELPFFGLAIGALWGILASLSKSAKDLLRGVVAVPLTGAVFYFFGLLLGAWLLLVGFSEETANWAAPIAFCLGAAIGFLPAVGFGWEIASRFRIRRRAWQQHHDQEPRD